VRGRAATSDVTFRPPNAALLQLLVCLGFERKALPKAVLRALCPVSGLIGLCVFQKIIR